MTTTPTILAIDASSVMIGYCVFDGAVFAFGEVALSGADIAERCRQAHQTLEMLLKTMCAIDCISIEAPASRFKKSLIPQCRISGALMALAALRGYMVLEIEPTVAKKVLAGKGNAEKAAMQQAAERYGVSGEHAADALGVALAAVQRITVER